MSNEELIEAHRRNIPRIYGGLNRNLDRVSPMPDYVVEKMKELDCIKVKDIFNKLTPNDISNIKGVGKKRYNQTMFVLSHYDGYLEWAGDEGKKFVKNS